MNRQHKVRLTPTISADIYADGDAFFATTEVPGFFEYTQGAETIEGVHVYCKDDLAPEFTLYFFNADTSIGAANAAATAFTATTVLTITNKLTIAAADYDDLGDVQVNFQDGLSLPVFGKQGSRSLYVAAVISGTPDFSGTDKIVIDLLVKKQR